MFKTLYNAKKIGHLSLLIVVMASQAHIAYSATLKNHHTKTYQNDYWRLYPISLQIHVHKQPRLPVSLIALPEESKEGRSLESTELWGASLDLNILYVNKSLWQYFNFYPRLGLAFNYHKLTGQGYIHSGLIYLEPNHQYATGYEFLPKLGIGLAYAKINGASDNVPPNASEEQDDTTDIDEINGYLKGPALALTLDLGTRFRLTPTWNLYVGFGINHLLALNSPKDQADRLAKNRLTFYNFNIGGSYTFNPNPKIFIPTQGPNKSRIKLGTFHAFAKAPWQAFAATSTQQPITKKPPSTDIQPQIADKEVYYLGGLYAQGSIQLANNHALTIGSEWVYNNGIKKEDDNQANGNQTTSFNVLSTSKFQKSVLLGHEFLWGKVTFGQAIAMYVFNEAYQANPLFGSFYTRLTCDCYVTKFLSVGTSIKTNILPNPTQYIAFDYIDFRLGYTF